MLKRVCILILILSAGCLLATGCSQKVKKVDNEVLEEEFKHAPAWVLNGHAEGSISAVGSAVIGKSGMQFAKTEALAHGRNELARQTSTKVEALVKNFVQQTGLGDDQLVDRFSKQMTKQITNETLSGSRQKDTWISPSSELYVLVVMDPVVVKEAVKAQLTTTFKSDEAKWQEFKAKNGEAELDQEIEKAFRH